MAIAISTAGTTISYAVETTAGTRPTAAADYTQIKGFVSIPEMNPEPEGLDCTPLEEEQFRLYIPGLQDLGGALSFTANLTDQFMTDWETMMTAYEAGATDNKSLWICVQFKKLEKALYFTAEPTALGMPGAEVNSVLQTGAYLTATNRPEWQAKPSV